MPNTIGSLVIDLVANTANFSTQLNAVSKTVESTVAGIKSAFGSLAGVFSLAGIAELTKDTLAFGDELLKASVKTGLGANAISELAFAAKQANIDLPELTTSIDKMEKSISQAVTGTATSKQAFDALGISLGTIKNLLPEQQFELIANQIAKLKDPADKTRAAIEIFGRAGADLLPLFEQGAAGIEAARQKAIDFGASLDSDTLKKLADANTSVRDLGASFSALATTLVAKVAPGIKGFFDSITDAVSGNSISLITKQIAMLQGQIDYASGDGSGANSPAIKELQGQMARAQIALDGAKLAKSINDTLAAGSALPNTAAPGFTPEIKPIEFGPQAFKIPLDGIKDFYEKLDEETQTGFEKVKTDTAKLQAQLQVLLDDGVINVSEAFKREFGGDNSKDLANFFATNAAQIEISIKENADALKQTFADLSTESKLTSENLKRDFQATAQFSVDVGKTIQDSFATAFDNIGKGGLSGLVKDFIDAFRKILDQALAFDLAKALGVTAAFQNQGSGSALGSIFSGIGSLFGGSKGTDASTAATIGFATGGAFKVGGTGGTDSQMVQFRASPDETVSITKPGQAAAAAIHFSPVYQIGSGVSRTDVISACAQTQKATIAQMTMLIQGGAFG